MESQEEIETVYERYNIPRRLSEIEADARSDDIHDDKDVSRRLRNLELVGDLIWIGLSLGMAIRMIIRREECMDQFGVDHYLAVSNVALTTATCMKVGITMFRLSGFSRRFMSTERFYYTKALSSLFYCMHLMPLMLVYPNCQPDTIIFGSTTYHLSVLVQLFILVVYALSIYVSVIVCCCACRFDQTQQFFYHQWIWFLITMITRLICVMCIFTLLMIILHLQARIILTYVELAAFLCYMIVASIFSYRNRRGMFSALEKRTTYSPSQRESK